MDSHKFTDRPMDLPVELLMMLHQKHRIFQQLTSEFLISQAKEASKKERSQTYANKSAFTYGEVEFISLGETIEIIKAMHGEIKPGGKFYDLGSGTGKAVISAALLHNFDKCIGIELLTSLFDISQQAKINYDLLRINILQENSTVWNTLPDVEFLCGNMFEVSWSDADFIFVNSTCFDEKMMDRIALSEVKPGTWAVTLTKSIASNSWKVLQSFRKSMSWGAATVYIHIRI